MKHICALQDEPIWQQEDLSWRQKLTRRIQRYTLISADNAYRFQYFRSDKSIVVEQKRQLATSHVVVHPFSMFRQWYEIYLIYLYLSVLLTKPVDTCFMSLDVYEELPYYMWYIIFTDVLCWVDIVMNLVTGYVVDDSNDIELRPYHIIKRYVYGPYFICDVLSSVSKVLIYQFGFRFLTSRSFMGFIHILGILKIARLVSLLIYVDKVANYVQERCRSAIFFLCNFILVFIIIHWMACLQFGTTRVIRFYFWTDRWKDTWINRMDLIDKPVLKQYIHSFFKSSAYILGIRIANIYQEMLVEEYVLAVVTYILGKFLVILTWTSLAVSILNSRSVNIKFAEIINQLDEYMKQKQLPLNLQHRISNYYCFKYQHKYFREENFTSLLSNNLKTELKLEECRYLITSVSLFDSLTPAEVNELVRYLKPEIYLPNDRVIKSGSRGHSMFFLASGTVAVYTHSGKEMCHLQDGAYFGEISLILKAKSILATVVAIETCQIYRLSRRNFERCLMNNTKIFEKMKEFAKEKMDLIMEVDDDYWKTLFEVTFLPRPTVETTENLG